MRASTKQVPGKDTRTSRRRTAKAPNATYPINRSLAWTRSSHTLREKRVEILLAVLAKAPQEKFNTFECEFGKVTRMAIVDPNTGEEKDSFYDIRINLRDILGADFKPGKEYNNREAAVEAIKGYNAKPIEMLSEDGKKWIGVPPFTVMAVDADKNYAYLRTTSLSWNYFRGLDNNFTNLNIGVALGLPSKHAVTMLMLYSGLQHDLELTMLTSKQLFGVENKYPNNYNFEKNVLIKGLTELEKFGFRFQYEIVRSTGKNHPAIGIKFLAPEKTKEESIKACKVFKLERLFKKEELKELRAVFTDEEIVNNIDIFRRVQLNGQTNNSFKEKIRELHIKSKDKENPKGWIIAVLKSIPERTYKPMLLPFSEE